MGHYQHLTMEERESTMVLLEQGLSLQAIARKLKRAATTISREISRNLRYDGIYSASFATKQYLKRRRNCGPKPIMAEPLVAEYVAKRLCDKWTPEQIAGRAKIEMFPFAFSYVTVYRAIDRHILPRQLKNEMRFKHRYKKYKTDDKRGIMQNFTSIKERSASVEKRKTIGHWESDTILGRRQTGAIGTHVERKTGYLIAFRLDSGSSDEYVQATVRRFADIPEKYRKTFTVDRGKEFTNHRDLARQLDMKVFFCDPYSPWQRGTNENTNGLLRQFYPKKTSFASITQEHLERTVNLINQRPRKRLGWRTPEEEFLKNFFR